jgi:pyruvate,water dikinase
LTSKYIYWFKQLNKDSIEIAGGKGANLGEMANAGFPVPPGFVISADAYWDFIVSTDLKDDVSELLDGLDVNDSNKLQDVANQIQKMIINQKMPLELKREIVKAYLEMKGSAPELNVPDSKKPGILKMSRENPFVAVRSSATAEDLPDASFAGQQATYLNIKGDEALIKAVQACWASLFTSRAITLT